MVLSHFWLIIGERINELRKKEYTTEKKLVAGKSISAIGAMKNLTTSS